MERARSAVGGTSPSGPRVNAPLRRALLPGATAAVLATLFLPWIRSGEVERNSFAAVRSAQRLEVGTPWTGWIAVLWFALPCLVGLVLLLVAVRRERLAAAAALIVGVTATALALVVLASANDLAAAPVLAVAAGAATVAAACWNLVRPIRRQALP